MYDRHHPAGLESQFSTQKKWYSIYPTHLTLQSLYFCMLMHSVIPQADHFTPVEVIVWTPSLSKYLPLASSIPPISICPQNIFTSVYNKFE
jgi:hypothetical protein